MAMKDTPGSSPNPFRSFDPQEIYYETITIPYKSEDNLDIALGVAREKLWKKLYFVPVDFRLAFKEYYTIRERKKTLTVRLQYVPLVEENG